jgi:hypothetical protein
MNLKCFAKTYHRLITATMLVMHSVRGDLGTGGASETNISDNLQTTTYGVISQGQYMNVQDR